MVIVAAACVAETPTERPRPSPTAGPPSIRAGSTFTSQFDGRRWTFQVIVDPHASPTDVSLEYGAEAGPFDNVFVMATAVLDAGQVSASTDTIPPDVTFCGRFVATNEFGTVSLDAHCHPQGPPPGAPSPAVAPSGSP
jgi:hypothetical protein